MEDTLRARPEAMQVLLANAVLILVLMEDTLRALHFVLA